MDRYNSKIAKLVGKLNGCTGNWAVTVSSTCTLYSCEESKVHTFWRLHEEKHKADIASWQFRKGKIFGWISWMATYLWRNSTVGYAINEFEMVARRSDENPT